MGTSSAQAARPSSGLATQLIRVVLLTVACGFIEVIGYQDANRIYPAIMTGNTVQLGSSLAQGHWAQFALLAYAIGAFFVGCIVASLIKRHLRHPPLELVIMAGLLVVVGFVRLDPALRIPLELPLLAFALAMQGETISSFGGVSLQTLVVTNNIVKFCESFVGRYLSGRIEQADRPSRASMLLPGVAWLSYSCAAALGAVAADTLSMPLLIPAGLLLIVSAHLLSRGK